MKLSKSSTTLIFALYGSGWIVGAYSQSPAIPSVAAPTAAERQLQTAPRAVQSPDVIAVPASVPESGPIPGAQTRFVLSNLEVRGVGAYPAGELLAPYAQLVGQTITVGKVFEIAQQMTARYRADGWTYSRVLVPAQEIAAGKVVLQAVEAHVETVEFESASGHRKAYERRIRSKIEAEKPLSQKTLEHYLLLMNDVPGVTASAALAPSRQEFGGLRVITKVSQQRFDASAGISNRGSRVLGPLQYDASVTLNALLGGYDSTRFSYVTTGSSRELEYFGLSQTWLLNSEGTKLELSASHSDSNPELRGELAALNLESRSKSYGMTLSHPFVRSRLKNLSVRLSASYHDGETSDDFENNKVDRIPTVRLGMTLDRADGWQGVTVVDLQVSRGIRVGNATLATDFTTSRPGASAEFLKAEAYLARLQSLGRGWSALLALQGQFAANDLLSSEEFAFGGPLFGRAYDASELVGDSGAAGKVELRYSFSGRDAQNPLFSPYAFFDAGVVRRRNPQPGEERRETATAAGLGVRFNLGSHVHGYVEAAKPLDHVVSAELDESERVFAGLSLSF